MASKLCFYWLITVFVGVCYSGCLAKASASNSPVESPWVWLCRDSRCVKEHVNEVKGHTDAHSLAACKLICHADAMLWPKPRGIIKTSRTFTSFLPDNLHFRYGGKTPSGEARDLMDEAIGLYIQQLHDTAPSSVQLPATMEHQVNVMIDFVSSDSLLKLETEESYQLVISTDNTKTSVEITAASFFGARHGLETLSQLIVWDGSLPALLIMKEVHITDSPAYPHRGLLVDTSRNFISVATIEKIIDAMSQNKLNVFHWHLTDAQSFPFVSEREPLMAAYGTYSTSQMYRPDDIRRIVHHATVRGVKVVPELDAPAHVGSGWEWGQSQGLGQLVLCLDKKPWTDYCGAPPCGLLNPLNEHVYGVLHNIYKDMADLFRNDVFHMGGDEIDAKCWQHTPEIVDWLKTQQREEDYLYLWSYFQNRSLAQLDQAYGNKQPVILWTSDLTENNRGQSFLDPKRYIIQVWTSGTDKTIADLYQQGYRLIISNFDSWYLDYGYGPWLNYIAGRPTRAYPSWHKIYENSPRKIIGRFNLKFNRRQILGGEAALWSEQVGDTGMQNKLWPRTAAFAERLWSDPDTDWKAAELRLIHHRQRLVERGIEADALQPEWCHQNEGLCTKNFDLDVGGVLRVTAICSFGLLVFVLYVWYARTKSNRIKTN